MAGRCLNLLRIPLVIQMSVPEIVTSYDPEPAEQAMHRQLGARLLEHTAQQQCRHTSQEGNRPRGSEERGSQAIEVVS